MDIVEDPKRALATLKYALVMSWVRFAMLERRMRVPFEQLPEAHLSDDRSALLEAVLTASDDEETTSTLLRRMDDVGLETVADMVDTELEEGELFAIEQTLLAERKLLELAQDLPDSILDRQLVDRIEAELAAGLGWLLRLEMLLRLPADGLGLGQKGVVLSLRADERQRVYDVWFGTDRSPIIADDQVIGFSSEPADSITLGTCSVTIPRTHKIGETRPIWWRRLVTGARPLSLQSFNVLSQGEFWLSVRSRLAEDGAREGDAIVFLHGYNVSFEEAAISAAQIGADLALPGPMAFYSWPSRGRMFRYGADEATIERSEPHIVQFLRDFTERSGARRIHLIAHSMGNRGLLRAVDRIAGAVQEPTKKLFGQIILAAPDVDRGTFRNLYRAYEKCGERTTLYVSDRDRAVGASRLVHDADRVGLVPPVTVLPGVDTVKVSNVDISFLGHGYVSGSREVLTDIHQLLSSEMEPRRRMSIRAVETDDGAYWELAS